MEEEKNAQPLVAKPVDALDEAGFLGRFLRAARLIIHLLVSFLALVHEITNRFVKQKIQDGKQDHKIHEMQQDLLYI